MLLLVIACQDYRVHGVPGGQTATISVEPLAIDYGVLELGESSSANFVVTNLGPAAATIDSFDLLYSKAFGMAAESVAPVRIEAGQSVDVAVDYAATTPHDLGTVVVQSDATNPTVSVSLSGAARVAELLVDPSSLDFVSTSGNPIVKSVSVQNVGLVPLTVEGEYIEESAFHISSAAPYDLAPGEKRDLPVTWTPTAPGEEDGLLWVESDVGDARIPLHGQWDLCYEFAEAWDQGWLQLSLEPSNGHVVANRSPNDVCMRHWMTFFSDQSQDAALGAPVLTGGDAQLFIAAGQSRGFYPGPEGDPSWYCVEQNQMTSETSDFWSFGAYVPEVLRTLMAGGGDAQTLVWNVIATDPVVLVGREVNVLELAAGEPAQVAVEAMNLGRVDATAEIVERLPPWLTVSDPGTAVVTLEPDGSSTLRWNEVDLAGAQESAEGSTVYDRRYLEYGLALASCPGSRTLGNEPLASWSDREGVPQLAEGSPLVVICHP